MPYLLFAKSPVRRTRAPSSASCNPHTSDYRRRDEEEEKKEEEEKEEKEIRERRRGDVVATPVRRLMGRDPEEEEEPETGRRSWVGRTTSVTCGER